MWKWATRTVEGWKGLRASLGGPRPTADLRRTDVPGADLAEGPDLWDDPLDDVDPPTPYADPAQACPRSCTPSEHNAGACARRLRCLARVAEHVWRYDALDTLLRDVAALLPFGMEHAEKARAEITWDGRSFLSDAFERGPRTLRCAILVEGHAGGAVEVSYVEPSPLGDGETFSAEEADLVQVVAHMLSVGVERRLAKESLGEAEQKFLNLFNNAHNGVLLITRQTKRCCRANPLFCQMFGYTQQEIGDLPLSQLQPPQEEGPEMDPLYDPLIGQHALRQDVPLLRKDGRVFFADVSSFPITVGNRDYWLDLFKDVTERMDAASRREKALDELQIHNQELKDFVYLVRHDLKAVHRGMNLLRCWTCEDRSDVSDAEIQAQTSLLAERVDRLDDLATLMARYTQIGQGDEPEVAVRLDDLVDDLISTLRIPPQVSVRVEGRLPVIRVRRTTIADIFSCLLDNALRQIGPAEGVIGIGCDADGEFWRLTISDSGPGIALQYQQGLFRLFQATPNGHWEDFGAALAMARRSVESCGGRIWVDSAVGRGIRIHFTLPKARSAEPVAAICGHVT